MILLHSVNILTHFLFHYFFLYTLYRSFLELYSIAHADQLIRSPFIARKASKYGVFSSPCFSVFGLNTEISSVNLCIQFDYRKIQTRKNSVFGIILLIILLLKV